MTSIVEIPVTMSSREIAELTGKRHDHVMADIRKMLVDLGYELDTDGRSPEFSGDVPDSYGRIQPAFLLPRELTEVLILGYSAPLRLKVVRRLRELEQGSLKPPVSRPVDIAELPAVVASLEIVARSLNVCESGKLQMYGAAFSRHGVDPVGLLPAYAVDAPAGYVTAGSSLPAFSLTHLLKEHGIQMSAIKVNKALEQAGLLELKKRPSTKSPDRLKPFWALTEYGLQYGKNVTSPNNPRETQPLFFADRFQQLLALIEPSETRH
ncbi:Rha family transcriptional regulator [Azotobacter vinelandii]|uniref:Rha family transcriptional regulator n=1 Tax=Azotobacter vinelandii TaxID=354 RepID=UPI0026665B22|nr:Rha family transcriptional regulator [Azotobacter vinelandii]WKN20853.1 Rha family transcriptional regulator [Azotobacter vinelandii]